MITLNQCFKVVLKIKLLKPLYYVTVQSIQPWLNQIIYFFIKYLKKVKRIKYKNENNENWLSQLPFS